MEKYTPPTARMKCEWNQVLWLEKGREPNLYGMHTWQCLLLSRLRVWPWLGLFIIASTFWYRQPWRLVVAKSGTSARVPDFLTGKNFHCWLFVKQVLKLFLNSQNFVQNRAKVGSTVIWLTNGVSNEIPSPHPINPWLNTSLWKNASIKIVMLSTHLTHTLLNTCDDSDSVSPKVLCCPRRNLQCRSLESWSGDKHH